MVKVIVATNVAESSITIPDCDHVVRRWEEKNWKRLKWKKKKQQQEELGREREYAQVPYDIAHEDKPCEVADDQQKCQVLITSL